MEVKTFFIYLFVMALVTYLVRVLPFMLVQKKIENRFIQSFLHYIPYSVLSAMTFPAILSATGSVISAWIGLVVAVFLAFCDRSLIRVAMAASGAVLISDLVLTYLL